MNMLCTILFFHSAALEAASLQDGCGLESRCNSKLVLHLGCLRLCLSKLTMAQVLVIVAASHLDAVTFQICSQSFKIMPTAVFAVWLLGQYLTPMQWSSLPVLAFGVVFVTMNGSSASHNGDSTSDQVLLGLGASALSGLSSAYAGERAENISTLPSTKHISDSGRSRTQTCLSVFCYVLSVFRHLHTSIKLPNSC